MAARSRNGNAPRPSPAGDGWPRAPRHGAGWPRILVADDDPGVRRYLVRHLPASGFVVLGADAGNLSAERVLQLRPDAFIVGTDLEGAQATAFQTNRAVSPVPVIVLLGRREPGAIIEVLEAGASDCMVKPVALGELAARLRKVLRQAVASELPWPVVRVGDLEMDFVRGTVQRRGENVLLTETQYRVLRQLAKEAGNVVSTRDLLLDGCGTADRRKVHSLRRIVQVLRAKLALDPSDAVAIASEAGVGYRLRLPPARPHGDTVGHG